MPNKLTTTIPAGRRKLWRRVMGPVGMVGLVGALTPIAVAAAIFSASIVGNANVFSSGALVMAGTTTAGICNSASGSLGSNVVACNGTGLPGTLSTTPSSTSITLSDVGSAGAKSTSMRITGCALQQVASSTGVDTGIAYGGVTYATSGPLGGLAMGFDGVSGNLYSVSQLAAPGSFSLAAWFRTTGTGSIISMSDAYSTSGSTVADRMIWIDSSGHVVVGINASSKQEVVSPTSYNDGVWHLVVATLKPTGAGKGLNLYVDGSLVANNKSYTSASSYNGYWHVGWSDVANGWADSPPSAYFNGSLSGVGVLPSVLSASSISSLYTSANFSAYSTGILAQSPTAYWSLNDSGTAGYTGAIPGASTSDSLSDISGQANTGMANGGVTLSSAGPTTLGGNSISLNGAAGSFVSTTKSYNNPEPASQMIWFKTSASGAFMGFTTQQSDTPNPVNFDRMFWVDPAGHVVYSIYSAAVAGSYSEVVSPGVYNDNAWHQAVATYGPSGQKLYIDGGLVASSSVAVTAQNYTGWWHLGYAYTNTWADQPTSNYFNGLLSQAAVFPSQLSSSQVSALYGQTSVSGEEAAVMALTPTSYWPLMDTAQSGACGYALISVSTTQGGVTACVYPNVGGACAAASAISTFSVASLVALSTTNPLSITSTMSVPAGLPANVSGARLIIGESYSSAAGTFTAGLSYSQEVVML